MKNILLFFFFILPFMSIAQFGSTSNGNPSSIKWKEISNESTKIIFPEGLESRAFRVADVIDYLNKQNRTSIGKPKGKINIILQNQLTLSNGFVTAGPLRSEFFTTAPQRSFLGTGNWLDLLAIHEYRHVMQLQFAKQGATKVGSVLLGDLGWIGMGFLAIPLWFTEGDAVMQETLLSKGGRGRSGSFMAEYRAMHAARISYKYEKIRNQSLKSILPNRYRMGYLLSQYGRNKYGNSFWTEVSKDAVRYKGIFWPFSKSLRKRTGKNIKQFYVEMMDSIYQKWDLDSKLIDWKQAKPELINKPIAKNKIAYYQYPKFNKNTILTMRSGRDRIPAFSLLDSSGKEKRLFDIGYQDSYYSLKNSKLVWTQTQSNIRWRYKTYSNIYIYDLKTKKKSKLTSKSKYFSPDINKQGDKILVVNSDEFMNYNVDILDANSGKLIKTIPNIKNHFLSSPKWIDDKHIIVISQTNQKNALIKIDLETNNKTEIIEYTHNLILNPVVGKDYIYFSADFTDVRNIFAVDLNLKNIYQITNSRIFASQPDISEDQNYLLYAEQQLNGVDIKKIKLDKNNWKPIIIIEPIERYPELEKLIVAEGGNILDKIPNQKYKVKDYNRIKNSLKFHSWYPNIETINRDLGFGYTIQSTNLLSTLDFKISPLVNKNGETKLSTSLTWDRYFPRLSLNHQISKFDYIKDTSFISLLGNYYYTEINTPLYFSRGSMLTGINISLSGGYQTFKQLGTSSLQIPKNKFLLGNKLRFYNKKVKAYKQINTTFGQEIDIEFRTIATELNSKDKIPIKVNAKLYFPGFYRTHSFTVGGHFHEKYNNIYSGITGNGIRGLKYQFEDINNVIRLDYAFPISYPDVAIGSLLFIKRLRANVFFDYGYGSFENKNILAKSIGLELRTDLGFFNLGDVITQPIGIRISYLDGVDYKWNIQFIIN